MHARWPMFKWSQIFTDDKARRKTLNDCFTGYSPSAQEQHLEPTLWVCLPGTVGFSMSTLYKYAWDTRKSTKVTFEILLASEAKQQQMQSAIARPLYSSG